MPDVSNFNIDTPELSKSNVPYTFKWSNWGTNVALAGAFDSPYTPWVPMPMTRIENPPNSPYFEITLNLQLNRNYDYKFVVDDVWVLDPNQPRYPDVSGNENHKIYIEAPKALTPLPSPTPTPKEPESPLTCDQEIDELDLKGDEHDHNHDVKPEKQSVEQQEVTDEVNGIIEEQKIDEHAEPENQLIEQQEIMNETIETIEEQKIVVEQLIEQENETKETINVEQLIEQENETKETMNVEQLVEQENETKETMNVEQLIEQETMNVEQLIEQENETKETMNVDEQPKIKETIEEKVVGKQETENEISITTIIEPTAEKLDEIKNVTTAKEEESIEVEEPVDKQEIAEESPIKEEMNVMNLETEIKEPDEGKGIIEKHQELSDVSDVSEIISEFLETKTLEDAIEEKSFDSGAESVVENVVESSDFSFNDEITNSLQPIEEKVVATSEEKQHSQIIEEKVVTISEEKQPEEEKAVAISEENQITEEKDTSKIIINETITQPLPETQVEETFDAPLGMNVSNEPNTEISLNTEVPSITEVSSTTEVPSTDEIPLMTEVSSTTEVSSFTEITGELDDLVYKKIIDKTILPDLDSTVTISNATITDNSNNTNDINTANNLNDTIHKFKDEIIDENIEPHEDSFETLVSTSVPEKIENDLVTENIIFEESSAQELEENFMEETSEERKENDHNVISDASEISSLPVEEILTECETAQEQVLLKDQMLEKTQDVSLITQQSSSISEDSEVFKENSKTTYEQISQKTETVNNNDDLNNLENKITIEQELVQNNIKNELDANYDKGTIVEESTNDVVSESSPIMIIQETTTEFHEKSIDNLEEYVEKSIPVQDKEISEVEFTQYDDWEVQIAENNTVDVTQEFMDYDTSGTKSNEQLLSSGEPPNYEPELEPVNEYNEYNEYEGHDIGNSTDTSISTMEEGNYGEPALFAETQFKDEIGNSTWSELSGSTREAWNDLSSQYSHKETISEEKLQGIDEVNEAHTHIIDNKSEPDETEEHSSDHAHPKMENEAFIIESTEAHPTENLSKVDKVYTISYINNDDETKSNLSMPQKDSMVEDTKPNEFESLGNKITTENSLSDDLLDDAPGSSATAHSNVSVLNSTTSLDNDKSDSCSIPNEDNTVKETKSVSRIPNGRRRGMTIYSSGESTKDLKSKNKKKPKLSSSREIVTANKFATQKYEDYEVNDSIFYLIASLITTFTLGIISMLVRTVSGNRK